MGLGQVCVSGFNGFAGVLQSAGTNIFSFGPVKKIAEAGKYYIGECSLKNQKTFYIGPVAFLNSVVKFSGTEKIPEGWQCFSLHASGAKSFSAAIEVFAKLPKLLEEFSTKIGEGEVYSRKFVVNIENSKAGAKTTQDFDESPQLNHNEQLCKKIGVFAQWSMSFGDFINEKSNCSEVSPLWDRVLPWVRITAGTYMGLQGLYEEFFVWQKQGAQRKGQVDGKETIYTVVNLAAAVSYLAYSILGGLGIYFGERASSTLKTLQFCGLAAVTFIPIAKVCAKSMVDHLHDEVKKDQEAKKSETE